MMIASPSDRSLNPPAFEATHIELVAQTNSKILGVSVYSGRAEVTRSFKFNIKAGQNQVTITGLPRVTLQESFRVEGLGSATIHDVTLSNSSPPAILAKPIDIITGLDELKVELERVSRASDRSETALLSIETYLKSLHTEHIDAPNFKLQPVIDDYQATAEKLDDKIIELSTKKKKLDTAIAELEEQLLNHTPTDNKLNLKASIGVFADYEGEAEIVIVYAVRNASWSPAYDVRVDVQNKDKPVTLVYKGAITQWTGEDWTDAPITLETATPTFDARVPILAPWTLSVEPFHRNVYNHGAAAPIIIQQPNRWSYSRSISPPLSRNRPAAMMSPAVVAAVSSRGHTPRRRSRSPSIRRRRRSRSSSRSRSRCRRPLRLIDMGGTDLEDRAHGVRELEVTSKGNVSATYTVPGLMSIPSDLDAHSVTIVQLELDAELEWVSVPKRDARMRLKAKVSNSSEYTLLEGPASVYVDGSFIAQSSIPMVSPEEVFDCPLGLDPSIRVIYPQVSRKTTQAGFITKSRVHAFTQRVTIHNTKASPIENVKIIDQIPISEDSAISVKLVSPSKLRLPDQKGVSVGTGTSATVASAAKSIQSFGSIQKKAGKEVEVKVPAAITVAQGVEVQWAGAEEASFDGDVGDLGRDGKLVWKCAIPAGGKVNLSLQWEVTTPADMRVAGL